MSVTSNPSVDTLRQTASRLRVEAARLDEQAKYLAGELASVEESARRSRADADHMEASAERLSTALVVEVSGGGVSHEDMATIRQALARPSLRFAGR